MTDSLDTETILHLLDQMREALVQRDISFLQEILADDYRFTTPIGTLLTKTQRIDAIASGRRPVSALAYTEVIITFYGETAIATGRYHETSGLPDQTGEAGRFTNVFVHVKDRWQLVVSHNSRIV